MSFIVFFKYFLLHLIVTLPGTVYYGFVQLYNRLNSINAMHIVYYPQQQHNLDIIMFVHGRNGHSSNFDPLIKNLEKLGVTHQMISINLGRNGATSVLEDTLILHNLVKEFENRNIILVGMSKGGLVVLNYIASYPSNNISKVITIASPLNGTMIADYLLPSTHISRIEFGWQSLFTQNLKEKLPYNIPIYHIVPDWDHMIIPNYSAYHVGPNHKRKYYSGLKGHIGIVYAQEVAQYIADWIS